MKSAIMKSAIEMAWEHGGADFQSGFDQSTAQAQEMKSGTLRVLHRCNKGLSGIWQHLMSRRCLGQIETPSPISASYSITSIE
jgi:hypothetical protein